jgi:hypothetical protein
MQAMISAMTGRHGTAKKSRVGRRTPLYFRHRGDGIQYMDDTARLAGMRHLEVNVADGAWFSNGLQQFGFGDMQGIVVKGGL